MNKRIVKPWRFITVEKTMMLRLRWVWLLAAGLTVVGCGHQGHQQNLGASRMISPGMSKQQVLNVMGEQPVKTEFYGKVEEWHYCKTGGGPHQFIALFFSENKTIAMRPYTVTKSDTKGSMGSCEIFVKMGNYREPDEVKELRLNVY